MSVMYGRLAGITVLQFYAPPSLPMFMEYTVGDYYLMMGQYETSRYQVRRLVLFGRDLLLHSFGVFVLTFGTVAILR